VSSFTDGTLNKLTRLGKLYRLLVHDTDQGREDYMELQDIPGFAPRSDAGADGTAYDFTAAGYTAYDDGRIYDGIAAHTNSGACTADFGNGAWPIKLINGNDPASGDIQAGDRLQVLVDATKSRFLLLNPASTRLTEQLVPAATQNGAAVNLGQLKAAGWITPTFQNGWGSSQPLQYRKDAAGVVWIAGRLDTVGTTTDNTILFTLPAGYRIGTSKGSRFGGVANTGPISVFIAPTGAVSVFGAANPVWVDLNLSYLAEN